MAETVYLIIVDYYSRYIEIAKLDRTAEAVTQHCKNIFSRHSIPEEVVTNNGSQFDSNAFRKFSKEYQFCHVTSSPYYPRSNKEAERGVKAYREGFTKERRQAVSDISSIQVNSTFQWVFT